MPKKKSKKAKPKVEPKMTQKERFLEYAKEVGVDETGEEFERVLEKIVLNKERGKT